jgi:hypothetical protein
MLVDASRVGVSIVQPTVGTARRWRDRRRAAAGVRLDDGIA